MSDILTLTAGDSSARIACRGAEPISWRVGERELLWNGDPAHWDFSAPILFPVVGASRGGVVRCGGVAYPMGQHGFARRTAFTTVDVERDRARLRLSDDAATRVAYPFPFTLDTTLSLGPDTLRLDFEVVNRGDAPMPYALGFHPAFLWPFDAADRSGHAVTFAEAEVSAVPEIAPGGLLSRSTRPIALADRRLPLAPELFSEALVFLHAKSRALAFASPTGGEIAMETEGFPHLAIWSRLDAPFLSLECWTGHADWADATEDLPERASMIVLDPGESGLHAVVLRYRPA